MRPRMAFVKACSVTAFAVRSLRTDASTLRQWTQNSALSLPLLADLMCSGGNLPFRPFYEGGGSPALAQPAGTNEFRASFWNCQALFHQRAASRRKKAAHLRNVLDDCSIVGLCETHGFRGDITLMMGTVRGAFHVYARANEDLSHGGVGILVSKRYAGLANIQQSILCLGRAIEVEVSQGDHI